MPIRPPGFHGLGLGILAATAALSAAVSPASAGPRDHSWGLEAYGGWNTYRLAAVNDSLRSLNRALGTAFAEIDGGHALGASVRLWADDRILLRLGLERQSAVSRDADRRLDIGAWSAVAGATWFFPAGGRVRFGAGVGAGVLWIRGVFRGPQFSLDAGGFGPDLRATGEAMWPLSSGWFVSGIAGARYARVGEMRLDEQATGIAADDSGLLVRIAVGRDGPPRRASGPGTPAPR